MNMQKMGRSFGQNSSLYANKKNPAFPSWILISQTFYPT